MFFVSNIAIGRMEETEAYNLRRNCEGKNVLEFGVLSALPISILTGMFRADPW